MTTALSPEDLHIAPGVCPRPHLSGREIEVLVAWLLADTKQEVTDALLLSASTVNTYIQRVRAKYEATGRPAHTKAMLLVRALQDGLLDLERL